MAEGSPLQRVGTTGDDTTHYASLDGLRGIAAYIVIVSHFTNVTNMLGGAFGFGAGQTGVMLFFVLSGFLMGKLYMSRPFTPANVGFFYRKRAARVVPLYFLVVLGSYVLLKVFRSPGEFYGITDHNLLEHLLFWRGAGILWTVPVEVQFYVLLPLLWFVHSRVGLAILLWIALIVSTVAALGFPASPAVLAYLPFFLFGIAASLMPSIKPRRGIDALFLVLVLAFVLNLPEIRVMLGLGSGRLWQSPVHMFLVPALVAAAVQSPLANRVLGSGPAAYLGRISYSVYLLHAPILNEFGRIKFLTDNTLVFLCLFVAAVTLVASLSFYYIEAPARQFIGHLGRRPAAASARASDTL